MKSIPGHFRMELLTDFVWVGQSVEIRVPARYCFDGASIPRIFWRVIGHPWGEYREAACVHDWLYSDGHIAHPEIERKQADQIFRRIMLEVGISRRKAAIMYRAVRIGGGRAWKAYRRGQQ